MCGRYSRQADRQRIAEWMETHDSGVFDESFLVPSYNVAPQSYLPVVRLSPDTGERELTIMRWGLIPFWAKDSKMAFNTINAKAEIVASITKTSVHNLGLAVGDQVAAVVKASDVMVALNKQTGDPQFLA